MSDMSAATRIRRRNTFSRMFSGVDEWADPAAWDAFVRVHPQSRYCQLFGYGKVVGCYGYRPRYLAFRRNTELVVCCRWPKCPVCSIVDAW
jgi:hypothetical protein